ncbi:MAG: J domain-containing protein [Pyrinomonadaceae bacterium]
MVNYYKLLNLSSNASTAQIKSAYRRLAHKKHPDLNPGDDALSREFAEIAKAYKVLSNPTKRARYDRERLKKQFSSKSIFDSDNVHARRARQMAYERQYNAIIDRMIREERNETMALQRLVFPLVALFVSTAFVAVFKPNIWGHSNVIGKAAVVMLFLFGVLHLIKRIHAGLERFTAAPFDIHDSIFGNQEDLPNKMSRVAGIVYIFVGLFLSLGLGLLIGNFLDIMNEAMMPGLYSKTLRPDFLFYPPIVVLLVDAAHSVFARLDR